MKTKPTGAEAAKLERLKRNMRVLREELVRAPARQPRQREAPVARQAPGNRPSAAIVCWDLAHNPAGRAFVLARLLERDWSPQLIGPVWPRFGSDVWQPIRHEPIDFDAFAVEDLTQVWEHAYRIALQRKFDVVIVSKPRLPGLVVGLAIAEQSGCPLLFDLDEDERSFTDHEETPEEEYAHLLREPFGSAGTRLMTRCWQAAGAYTVSNRTLSPLVEGATCVVRHARDEGVPVPDRSATRRALGLGADDFVLAFIGTVRQHKGLDLVFDAMEAIADQRLKLIVSGTVADRSVAGRIAALRGRAFLLPPCDLEDLGHYLAAADVVPLIMDLSSAISRTQIPAKLTDALQHGVAVVATGSPPMLEVAVPGAVEIIAPDGLEDWLREALKSPRTAVQRDRARANFLDEFSFAVNRARLENAINLAAANLERTRAAVPDALAIVREATEVALRLYPVGLEDDDVEDDDDGAEEGIAGEADVVDSPTSDAGLDAIARASAGALAETCAVDALPAPTANAPAREPASRETARCEAAFDIAFFWKQNDSDIYGRRSDMLAKAFAAHANVGTVLHFDNAILRKGLARLAEQSADAASAYGLIYANTVRRVLRFADEDGFVRRTRLRLDPADAATLGGLEVDDGGEATFLVRDTFEAAGIDSQNTVAWVCPIVSDIDAILDAQDFALVAVDLIDDQREWATSDQRREAITTAYRSTLERADLVFTNCEENRARFSDLRSDIIVVPNGAELAEPTAEAPHWLMDLPGPRIGYVGNLANRIDWEIVLGLARKHPDWSFVMIGSRGHGTIEEDVLAQPNIHFAGVLPYDTARAAMRTFDAALVPHTVDSMTEAMNPLKIYNYLAAGLPVVGTPAANAPDTEGLVTIATDAEGFSVALSQIVANPESASVQAEAVAAFSWDARMAAIMERIEAALRERQGAPRAMGVGG